MVVTDSHGLYYSYLYTPFQCTRPQSGGFNRLLTPLTLKNGMSGQFNGLSRTYISNITFNGSRGTGTSATFTGNFNNQPILMKLTATNIASNNSSPIVYGMSSDGYYGFACINSGSTLTIQTILLPMFFQNHSLIYIMPYFSTTKLVFASMSSITPLYEQVPGANDSVRITGTTTIEFYRLNI